MIHRVIKDKDNPYFMMRRETARDASLSFKALGILAYLISKPDNWQFEVYDLVKSHKGGRESVVSGLKELREAGYVAKVPIRNEKGQITHWEGHIYESPIQNTGNPSSGDNSCQSVSSGDKSDRPIRKRKIQNLEKPEYGFSATKVYREKELEKGKKDTPLPKNSGNGARDSGFAFPEDPPRKSSGEFKSMTDRLHEGIALAGKIMCRPSLVQWERQLKTFVTNSERPLDEIRAVLTWYSAHVGERFIPRAYSAKTFCEKFVQIEEARERYFEDNPDERPTPHVPPMRMTDREYSEEEINAILMDS